MIPGSFNYHAPSSLDEAIKLLDDLGDDAKILAGGHSLIPMMKLRLAEPDHLGATGKRQPRWLYLRAIPAGDGVASAHDWWVWCHGRKHRRDSAPERRPGPSLDDRQSHDQRRDQALHRVPRKRLGPYRCRHKRLFCRFRAFVFGGVDDHN